MVSKTITFTHPLFFALAHNITRHVPRIKLAITGLCRPKNTDTILYCLSIYNKRTNHTHRVYLDTTLDFWTVPPSAKYPRHSLKDLYRYPYLYLHPPERFPATQGQKHKLSRGKINRAMTQHDIYLPWDLPVVWSRLSQCREGQG